MPFAQPNWAGGVSPFAVPVYVESTITEPPGSNALVTDVNENGTAVELRFRIPRGDVGATGERGDPGQDAADPIFSTTVTSHSPTATPSVSISGDYPTKLLSFVLRDGEKGSDGEPGVPGEPGQDAADPIFSTIVTSHSPTATPSVSISGDYPTKLLSFVLRDGADGEPGPPGADGAPGLSSSVFEYQFQTATTPPPPSGHVRPNSTTPATTTSIYVAHLDSNGVDQSIILSSIQPGSLISLQKKTDDTTYVRFATSGFTSHTGWTEFFVTEQSSAGLLTNNMQIIVVVQTAGIPGPPGQDAVNPSFTASVTTSGPAVTPAVSLTGSYPNLELGFSLRDGQDGSNAVNPNFTAGVTSSGPSVTPAVSLTGSYPNLALGFSLRDGQDGSNAVEPNFTASLVASGVGVTPAVALTGTYPNLNLGISLQSGAPGAGSASYIKFARSVNNESAGFYSDAYIIVGWNPTSSEIMIRQPTARANVTATALVIFGGSFPSGQNMLLSTVSNDFYFQSSFGQILFIIASESDTTHPFYRFHVTFTSSSGTSHVYALVEKFT
jgi:hypothetical protein